jgi:diphthamide synthase (EF-2-diphthine--ammonia ligase)
VKSTKLKSAGPERRVPLFWSSGKDSAWALHVLRQDPATEVVALLTTVSTHSRRVAVHDVPRNLVAAQAAATYLLAPETGAG